MDQSISDLYKTHLGYVSDKWASYLPVYDRWFLPYRNREISFLEIGVQNGGSLQIWNKYFNNAKNIIGCDINTQCGQLVFDKDRV